MRWLLEIDSKTIRTQRAKTARSAGEDRHTDQRLKSRAMSAEMGVGVPWGRAGSLSCMGVHRSCL